MEENVLPSLRWSTSAADFICQHDNASIYTAKVTKAWFVDKNVYIGQLNHRSQPNREPVGCSFKTGLYSGKAVLDEGKFDLLHQGTSYKMGVLKFFKQNVLLASIRM